MPPYPVLARGPARLHLAVGVPVTRAFSGVAMLPVRLPVLPPFDRRFPLRTR